jgi:hypothetical protein
MAEVRVEKQVTAPPSEVWERIGDFQGLHTWAPGFPEMESAEGGKVRRIGAGDNAIVEELVEECDHSYSYRILQGPLPVENYVATLAVSPAAAGEGCTIAWSAKFDAVGLPDEQVVTILENIFNAGLSKL